MIRFLLGILLLTVFMGIDRLLQDPGREPNGSKRPEDTSHRHRHPTDESRKSIIPEQRPTGPTTGPQSAQERDDSPSEIDKRIARWTKGLAIFTGALAFFTLIAAGASIYQSIVLSGQLAEMQKASADAKTLTETNKELANAAGRSAEAAQSANALNLGVQRPFIISVGLDIHWQFSSYPCPGKTGSRNVLDLRFALG